MKYPYFFALFICVFVTLEGCKSAATNTSNEAAKMIPYFTFATLDKKLFVKDSFDNVRTKFIFYFNSECEHCQKQGAWLAKDIALFSDVEMVFISYEEIDAIKKFRDKYKFHQENIIFLQDSRLTFSHLFGMEASPSLLIYSKEGKLIRSFEGETKVSEIIKFTQQ